MTSKHKPDPELSIALVVEDEPAVTRIVVRTLSKHFKQILTTSDPYEVQTLLEKNRVTHIVSDCYLGEDIPLSIDFIPAWRKACRSIAKVVLFTGTGLGNTPIPPEIDEIVQKTSGPEALLKALEIL